MTWQANDMASRLANEFSPGEIVLVHEHSPINLWEHIPVENAVVLICTNGVVGAGPRPRIPPHSHSTSDNTHQPIGLQDWGSIVDPNSLFNLLQSNRIDTFVIDAIQIDHTGSIVPKHTNMTDYKCQNLAGTGSPKRPRIIAAISPADDQSKPALQSSCKLPTLVDIGADMAITKHGLFAVQNNTFQLLDLAPNVNWEHLTTLTDATLTSKLPTNQQIDDAASDDLENTVHSDLFKDEHGNIVATSSQPDTKINED